MNVRRTLASLFIAFSCSASGVLAQTQLPSPQQQSALASSTDQHTQDLAFTVADWLHLAEGQGTAEEYLDFLQHNPNWPLHRQFSRRLQNALNVENDRRTLHYVCTSWPLTQGSAFMACLTRLPPDTELMEFLTPKGIAAWENDNDDPQEANALHTTFSSILSPQSTYKRFLRQERAQHFAAAQETISQLPVEDQAAPRADLALKRNLDTAPNLYSALSKEQQRLPLLRLHEAIWLRKHKSYQPALNLWHQGLTDDEKLSHDPEYWRERNTFARILINSKNSKEAYFLADDPQARGEGRLDSLFLAGWIALRLSHNPNLAIDNFTQLTSSSSLITQARGYYWLGCAEQARHQENQASIYWMRASLFPSTFYGQMASSRLEGFHNILLTPNALPSITTALIKDAASQKTPSAQRAPTLFEQVAQILYSTGYEQHIREFLIPQTFVPLDPTHRFLLAQSSSQMGAPDVAVALARQSTRDGYFLFPLGWPRPYPLPPSTLPSGLVNSLIRQESSYNPQSVSYSNAIGLMQMKPATAMEMQQLAEHTRGNSHTPNLFDPQNSMKLGQLYLQQIGKRFNNNVPLMAAAYNAGPHRVTTWFNENGNPSTSQHISLDAMIDWIELIPDSQTRNYVQRVWENMITYHILEQK